MAISDLSRAAMRCRYITSQTSEFKDDGRSGPCPVSERLAKQKFSHWGFPVHSNEAEFFLLNCLANRSLTGQHLCMQVTT